jgi:hypothetical protein
MRLSVNPSIAHGAFLLHCAASLYMTGVIWFVQIVHYPLFANVGRTLFPVYERHHTNLTSFVVMPPMLVEIITALILCYASPRVIAERDTRRLLALTVLIWTATFALHLPQHAALTHGFDEKIHEYLVLTNWFRTLLWSAKALLCAALMHRMLRPFLTSNGAESTDLITAAAD